MDSRSSGSLQNSDGHHGVQPALPHSRVTQVTKAVKTGGTALVRAGSIYALANVLAAGVPFLLLPILTRVLDTQEFGTVTVFFVFVACAGAVAGLSLHGAVGVRWFTTDAVEFPRYVSSCIAVSAASTAITGVLTLATIAVVGVDFGLSLPWVGVAVVAAGANSMLQVRLALWQSQARVMQAALLQCAVSTVNVGLSLIAVVGFSLGGAGRMGAAFSASVLAALLSLALLAREGLLGFRPAIEHVMSALRFGLPLVPHGLAAVVMATADRLIVSERLGTAAAGVYGAAAQLGMVMMIGADAFVKSYGPWMYERLSRGTSDDELTLVGMTYLSVPAFVFLGVLAGGLMSIVGPIVLPDAYHEAIPLVWWFTLGGAFTGMYYSVAGLIFFSSRTELISIATVLSGACGLPLGYWLVGVRGMEGAAMAFAFTQAALFLIALAIAMRIRRMPWRQVARGMAMACLQLRSG